MYMCYNDTGIYLVFTNCMNFLSQRIQNDVMLKGM